MKFKSKNFFKISAYILVFLVAIILVIFRFNYLQRIQLENKLKSQAEIIENQLKENITYSENILKYVAYHITQHDNYKDYDFIYESMASVKDDNKIKKLLSWSSIEWLDEKNFSLISANLGKIQKPVDLSKRDYITLANNKPGKIFLGKAVIGSTSNAWIIPAGYGVNSKNGIHTGTLAVGFDIAKIDQIIKNVINNPKLKAALIDDSSKAVMVVNDNTISLPRDPSLQKWLDRKIIYNDSDKTYFNSAFLRIKDSSYLYKFENYPYILYLNSNSKFNLSDVSEIIFNNISELLLILILISVALYFIYKSDDLRPSLSQDYFIFAVIVTTLASTILIWLFISFYKYQGYDQKYRYSAESEKIVNEIEEQFNYVENLAGFIGQKIANLKNSSPKKIAEILDTSFGNKSQNLEIFSWSLFDFINKEGNVIASGTQGVLENPHKVTNRSYLNDAPKKPWKIALSQPDVGIVSGELVIPAGIAIVNKESNKYIGIISMGFNINRLIKKINNILAYESTDYVVLDKEGKVILSSTMKKDNINDNFFKDKLDYIKDNNADSGLLPQQIEHNDIVYSYYRNIYNYPYTILIGESNTYLQQKFNKEMLPRIIEFVSIWLFVLVILFFFRMKIVSPLLKLSHAAKEISNGNIKVIIPHTRSVETNHLSRSLISVKRAFIREQRLKDELNKAREKAEIASNAKTDFLSATAHELRSPLNAVIGMSSVMKARIFGDNLEKYCEYAADIEQAGQELLDFITDLLDMNKIEKGNFYLDDKEWLDLKHTTDRALKLNISRLYKKNMTIVCDFPDDLPKLYADGRRLRQILVNLVSNSIKYSPENTKITISAKILSDGRLEIKVQDQGIGMSEQEITKALNRKIVDIENHKSDSFSLGIPITKHLANLHEAEFIITSEVGVGTEIRIIFPREVVEN